MKKFALVIAAAGCMSGYGQYGWNSVGSGTNFSVQALATDANNQVLYAGGLFTTAGGNTAVNVAKWDGANYSPLGAGVVSGVGVNCLQVMPNSDLIAGGSFSSIGGITATNIARWSGSAWNSLGNGLQGSSSIVKCLAIYNNELYAGGVFTHSGINILSNIAKWDGNDWLPVGGGMNGPVTALSVYNGELYAGGNFSSAGGTSVNNIAKWDGNTWSDVGGGLNYTGTISVSTFQVYLGNLYAGGTFNTAGATAVRHIAQWDGTSWSDVGGGASDYTGTISVSTFQVFHNELIIGGTFDTLGTMRAAYIGKWDGVNWSTLGNGMNNSVYALATMGDTLYAGGWFTQAGNTFSPFVAEWQPAALFAEGVKENYSSKFQLAPNPATNKLTIRGKNSGEEFSVTVMDPMGRCVQRTTGAHGAVEIARGDLPAGIYFYRIDARGKELMQEGKIIFAD